MTCACLLICTLIGIGWARRAARYVFNVPDFYPNPAIVGIIDIDISEFGFPAEWSDNALELYRFT